MKRIITIISAVMLMLGAVIPVSAASNYNPIGVELPVKVKNGIETSVITMEGTQNMPEITEVKPDSDGNAVFKMFYDEPGEYDYTVYQKQTDSDLIPDETLYNVRVFISGEDDLTLTAQVLAYIEGKDEKPDAVFFQNRSKASPEQGGDVPAKTPTPSDTAKVTRNDTGTTYSGTTAATTNGVTLSDEKSPLAAPARNARTGDRNLVLTWAALVLVFAVLAVLGIRKASRRDA